MTVKPWDNAYSYIDVVCNLYIHRPMASHDVNLRCVLLFAKK